MRQNSRRLLADDGMMLIWNGQYFHGRLYLIEQDKLIELTEQAGLHPKSHSQRFTSRILRQI